MDDCGYYKVSGSKFIFMLLYVDDILSSQWRYRLIARNREISNENLEMKDLGDVSFVFGIQNSERLLLGYSGIITKDLYR